MTDYAYAKSDAIAVTLNKWYALRFRQQGADDVTWRVKLRYETETANELDGGDIRCLYDDEWAYFGYCFKAQYTDPDFRIYLIVTTTEETIYIDDLSFKEVLLEGAVDFKYDYDETRRSSDWIRVNPQGVITPIITANDFRVKFRATDYRPTVIHLDYMNVRYKLVDKRAVRGLHGANENVG